MVSATSIVNSPIGHLEDSARPPLFKRVLPVFSNRYPGDQSQPHSPYKRLRVLLLVHVTNRMGCRAHIGTKREKEKRLMWW